MGALSTQVKMSPPLRRLLLAVHIAASVSWIGAVGAFLALSVAGVMSADGEVIRAAYVAMNLISLYVVIPLSLAALLSGATQALLTPWGLLKHYWVLSKLVLTLLAGGLLMLHQFTAVAAAANRVRAASETLPSAGRLGVQLVTDGSLAVLALLSVVALAVYKPRGVTPFGRAKNEAAPPIGGPGKWAFAAVVAAVVLVFFLVHATGMTAAHG